MKSRLLIFLSVTAIFVFPLLLSAQDKEAEDKLKKILLEGSFSEVKIAFEGFARLRPKMKEELLPYFVKSALRDWKDEKQQPELLDELSQIMKFNLHLGNRKEINPYYMMGQAYIDKKDYKEAVATLSKATNSEVDVFQYPFPNVSLQEKIEIQNAQIKELTMEIKALKAKVRRLDQFLVTTKKANGQKVDSAKSDKKIRGIVTMVVSEFIRELLGYFLIFGTVLGTAIMFFLKKKGHFDLKEPEPAMTEQGATRK